MSGAYSREALAARLGDKAMALAEASALAAPPPGPEAIERLRRILAPAVAHLAEQDGARDLNHASAA